jgi:hypothetical protein
MLTFISISTSDNQTSQSSPFDNAKIQQHDTKHAGPKMRSYNALDFYLTSYENVVVQDKGSTDASCSPTSLRSFLNDEAIRFAFSDGEYDSGLDNDEEVATEMENDMNENDCPLDVSCQSCTSFYVEVERMRVYESDLEGDTDTYEDDMDSTCDSITMELFSDADFETERSRYLRSHSLFLTAVTTQGRDIVPE